MAGDARCAEYPGTCMDIAASRCVQERIATDQHGLHCEQLRVASQTFRQNIESQIYSIPTQIRSPSLPSEQSRGRLHGRTVIVRTHLTSGSTTDSSLKIENR